jgi:hypothetical protein
MRGGGDRGVNVLATSTSSACSSTATGKREGQRDLAFADWLLERTGFEFPSPLVFSGSAVRILHAMNGLFSWSRGAICPVNRTLAKFAAEAGLLVTAEGRNWVEQIET